MSEDSLSSEHVDAAFCDNGLKENNKPCSQEDVMLNDWNAETNSLSDNPHRPQKRGRNGSQDTDEHEEDGKFILVERKRRSKRIIRSLSPDNLPRFSLTNSKATTNILCQERHPVRQENTQSTDTTWEICLTSKDELPKQVGLAKLLRSEGIQNIQKITYKNSSKVLIRFNDEKGAEQLLKSTKFNDSGYRCQLTNELNFTYGVIRQIELDVTEEEIKNTFECEHKIVSARRLKRLDEKGTWVDSETVRLCFMSPTLPTRVYAYGYGIKVELNYFPVTQCSGCWKFGHAARLCSNKKKICPKCGGAHVNCETKLYVCVNCKGSHMALDKRCPEYLKEKTIRTIMTENNCSYRVALQTLLNQADNLTKEIPGNKSDFMAAQIQVAGTAHSSSTKYSDALVNGGNRSNTDSEMEHDGDEPEKNIAKNRRQPYTKQKQKQKNARPALLEPSGCDPKPELHRKAPRDESNTKENNTPQQENRKENLDSLSWVLFLRRVKDIYMSQTSFEEKIKEGLKLVMDGIKMFVLQFLRNNEFLSTIISSIFNG
jgi:hypothetical protein